MSDHKEHFETTCVHAGRGTDPTSGGVSPAIQLSTTFERGADGNYPHGHTYSRSSNPNRGQLEACLAALEGGATALAFASGSAAVSAVFQSLKPDNHVVCTGDAYHGVLRILREVMTPWRLKVSYVDASDTDALRAAVTRETRLVWVESPSNPLLRITDLTAAAEIAHKVGAVAVCDSTFATPVLQKPLEYGMDMVMHSTTKYLGGHSDVLGGALVCRKADAFAERVRFLQSTTGAVPSPFDCWLLLRGAATLHLRVRAASANALEIARHLATHPAVEKVFYPGLESHPGHALAARQMRGFGAMLSFTHRGGEAAAMNAAAKVKLFTRATSLGGVESLIEHRASVEGPETQTPRNLLRVSAGVEHPADLIADLDQALS
ncbi:MAG TPA: aminotransferase class V-fold PLP-dependent enzyme [Gammaproteobacteria bacterium]|jgi:cystathionine gamma-synthase|nr:aminotransferase class V-fold PLP-dependent enzyme [Gammaproteobacteria bacterium]